MQHWRGPFLVRIPAIPAAIIPRRRPVIGALGPDHRGPARAALSRGARFTKPKRISHRDICAPAQAFGYLTAQNSVPHLEIVQLSV
jgi:hypothetical protein